VTPINRQPVGLLGFLGIKNGGRNPQTLGEVLVPQWDLSELYLNSSPQYVEVISTEAGVGYTVAIGPPQGELWYVFDAGLEVGTGVGVTWSGYLARAAANNAIAVPMTDLYSVVASSRVTLSIKHPVVLAPGESLGWNTRAVAGVASVYYAARYAVLTN